MATNLVELLNEANEIEKKIIEAEGEITNEVEAMLAINEKTLAQKIDAYQFVGDNLLSKAEFYRSMAEKYLKAAKSLETSKENIFTRIKEIMLAFGIPEIAGKVSRFKIVRNADKIVITDQNLLPSSVKTVVTDITIDRVELRKIMKEKEIEGAHFEPVFSLKDFVNKE